MSTLSENQDRVFQMSAAEIIQKCFKDNNLYGIFTCVEGSDTLHDLARNIFYYGPDPVDGPTMSALANRGILQYFVALYGKEKLHYLVDYCSDEMTNEIREDV